MVKTVWYHRTWDVLAVHEGPYVIEVDAGAFAFWPHYLRYGRQTAYMLQDACLHKDWTLIGML